MTGQRWGVLVPQAFRPQFDVAEFYYFERCDCGKVRGYATGAEAMLRAADIRTQTGHSAAAKASPVWPEIEARYGVEVVG